MIKRSLVIIFFVFCSKTVLSQVPDSVKGYLDSALYLMQSQSLSGKNLDWQKIKDSVYLIAKDAKNYKEAFPAMAYAFRQLKDFHGMVANQDTFYRYPPPIEFEKVLSAGIKKEFLKGPRIVTHFFKGSVAYLRIPTMNVTTQEAMDGRANKLRDSLCMLLARNPKGIIIDLRMNSGGNSAPMVSGISPLFQITMLGYGVDREGNLLGAVRLQDGVLTDENGRKSVSIKNTCSVNKAIPIAVLIGPSTVSSGEILTAYLEQQSNVKTFGEPTPGYCNATEGFLFSNNQGYLLLSVNKIANAKKHVFKEMFIRPDVYVKSDDNYENLEADPIVIRSLKWLKSKSK